jgi:hypothetical protein
MASHRDKVVALFEKHRIKPGTPYDEDHFLDFLLHEPKKKRAVYNRFRGLRRFNAFIDEVQYEFAVCFSLKDHDANYSLDKFVDRVKELETSHRSSLASLSNQIQAGPGWNFVVIVNFILLVVAIWLRNSTWAIVALIGAAAFLNGWFLWFSRRTKTYHARLLTRIEDTQRRLRPPARAGQLSR